MGVGAGAHAQVATHAAVEVDEQQVLRLEQSLVEELVHVEADGQLGLLAGLDARVGDLRERGAHVGESFQHGVELGRLDADDVHAVEGGTGRAARLVFQQADLAEVIAATQVGAHHFAAGERLRNFHHALPDEIKRVRRVALLADGLALVERDELDVLLEAVHEKFIE